MTRLKIIKIRHIIWSFILSTILFFAQFIGIFYLYFSLIESDNGIGLWVTLILFLIIYFFSSKFISRFRYKTIGYCEESSKGFQIIHEGNEIVYEWNKVSSFKFQSIRLRTFYVTFNRWNIYNAYLDCVVVKWKGIPESWKDQIQTIHSSYEEILLKVDNKSEKAIFEFLIKNAKDNGCVVDTMINQ